MSRFQSIEAGDTSRISQATKLPICSRYSALALLLVTQNVFEISAEPRRYARCRGRTRSYNRDQKRQAEHGNHEALVAIARPHFLDGILLLSELHTGPP